MASRPLRIAINGLFLLPPMGGLETYLRELCRALLLRGDAPELTLYLTESGHAKLAEEDWASEAQLVCSRQLGRHGLRALSELALLGPVADRRGADVIHSIALTGPLASRAARVVTVADVTWLTHPGGATSPMVKLTHQMWRAVVPQVARRADEVIAISEDSAAGAIRHLRLDPARVTTTLLGAGSPPSTEAATPPAELRARLGLGDGPIVLNVGQKGDHRNLDRLVRAFAQVRAQVPGAQLVMPGPPSPAHEAVLRRLAAEAGIGDAVHLPGFVARDDLDGLYAAAAAFVLPSLVEGFGLPVLEAMQRGTPVTCTAGGAPGEIAGDAAVTFDPRREGEIAGAITQLLTDPALRDRLRTLGRARAASFTWERCAAQTLEVYARAAGR